jgi:hypothetical protein
VASVVAAGCSSAAVVPVEPVVLVMLVFGARMRRVWERPAVTAAMVVPLVLVAVAVWAGCSSA